jgi:hypothetical protein
MHDNARNIAGGQNKAHCSAAFALQLLACDLSRSRERRRRRGLLIDLIREVHLLRERERKEEHEL